MESLYQSKILEAIRDTACILDATGTITYTNPNWDKFTEENEGNVSKTGVGVNYLEVVKAAKTNSIYSGINNVISGKVPYFETEYPCHSPKTKRWFLMQVSPIPNEGRRDTLVLHIDITTRKKAELRLAKSHEGLVDVKKKLEKSIYHTLHDLKGPIGNIKGLISLLGLDSTNTDKEIYQNLETSINNLEQFIQRSLNEARFAKTNNPLEEVNMVETIENYIESIEHGKELENLDISLSIKGSEMIYTYLLDIQIVISNLIMNAIKYRDYAKDEGFVKIDIINTANKCVIKVEDNGIGVPSHMHTEIFESHVRANESIAGGTGIGLFLVKSSVAHLGGTIELDSILGKGSTFTVTIPKK